MVASLFFILFCLADWVLLWALPHLQISFSPRFHLPLGASIMARSLLLGGLTGVALLSHKWRQRRVESVPPRPAVALFLAINVAFTVAQVDAYVLEPIMVERTDLTLAFEDLDSAAPPVRIVHITDTHIERNGVRETAAVRQINAFQPDIIVLTGDYLNLSYLSDATSLAHFHQFIAQLYAPYGIYAVRGSVEVGPESMARLVEGTQITWLEQETQTVNVRGQVVTLAGVACSHRQEEDARRLARTLEGIPPEAFTLLLYHSPDLIFEAAEQGVDLYLAGHTHGGQLRLPVIGPIVTYSRYGRRYGSGLAGESDTTIYVSRGLGFEGGSMPRARFLCRPEIVGIELVGSELAGSGP